MIVLILKCPGSFMFWFRFASRSLYRFETVLPSESVQYSRA
jgi:hypothetical protein